jgi:hypothetical protein
MKHKYNVAIDQTQTHYETDGEEWGWSESEYSNSFNKISRSVDKYGDLESDTDLKEGDTGYLVWLEYSTGSTFGRSKRGCTMACGLFKDKASARALEKAIREYDYHVHGFSFKFQTPDGQEIDLCASWCGYFENLEDVHIETVEIE